MLLMNNTIKIKSYVRKVIIIIYNIKNSLWSFRQRYILAHATDTSVAQNIIFYVYKVIYITYIHMLSINIVMI